MIEGVILTKLNQIKDERGKIMHMMRVDNPIFQKFGEIYFSTVKPNYIKAWHLHKEATLNIMYASREKLSLLFTMIEKIVQLLEYIRK